MRAREVHSQQIREDESEKSQYQENYSQRFANSLGHKPSLDSRLISSASASVIADSKKMAACSLSALPMTATAQAAFSTHDGKELTPPQFLRMHCCIRSVPEPDQNRK